ncbi:hypothetical protein QBC47DRAFT_400669 [Echria macrotheca]|uniref:Uncharacterized protein n=1 Tax=Echria macrotheca TaxID=438768 RepID=A0AAJ0BF07_9PEZI|nr:hypothetical protein QBC47DRAFT_400669 [Echria macrotheca]
MPETSDSNPAKLGDRALAEEGRRIRYAVLNFIHWVFKDCRVEIVNSVYPAYERKPRFLRYVKSTTVKPVEYTDVLLESEGGPIILEAFLWNVLVNEVLGQYLWAGETDSALFLKMKRRFLDGLDPDSSCQEGYLKWREWVSTTIPLLHQSTRYRIEEMSDGWKDKMITDILDVIGHGMNPLDRGRISTGLHELIDAAVKQDEILCLQQPDLRWLHDDSKMLMECKYKMEDREQRWKRANEFGRIKVRVAPALVNVYGYQGKESDIRLDATTLMKGIVHCEVLHS